MLHPSPTLFFLLLSFSPQAEDAGRRERFVLSVAASPDGRRLAAGAMDGTVALFDAATGAPLHRLPGHHKPVRSLTFTPDSAHLLTASDDTQVNMYDVAGARRVLPPPWLVVIGVVVRTIGVVLRSHLMYRESF